MLRSSQTPQKGGVPTSRGVPLVKPSSSGLRYVKTGMTLSQASALAAQKVMPSDAGERNKIRAIHQILVQHDSLPEDQQDAFLEMALEMAEKALEEQERPTINFIDEVDSTSYRDTLHSDED